MQKLKADTDIESGKFEKVYLLYGDEPYLVRTYKNRLRKAIIPEEGSMNYAYYDSMPDNVETVTEFADTLPFFGDRRLVILDKTNAFKKALEDRGVTATVRREMGRDIDGACGQLRKRRMDG